jgi:hypothetical protein
MSEKWTPGPWRVCVNERHGPDECDLTICGDIFMLADINGPNYPHCEPNARLIRAAPAMAKALREIVAWKLAIDTCAPELGGLLASIYRAEALLTQVENEE